MSKPTSVFLNNAIVMEAFYDFRDAQPPKDALHYMDTVMEAVQNPNTQGKLIQILYDDIIRHSDIDFGKIGDSKGDITRYYYYDPMYRCIDILNKLAINKSARKDLDVLNRLHDVVIEKRADFEFGYKFGVDILQLTYELLVMTVYEMINVCIYEYTDELKSTLDIEFRTKNTRGKKQRAIVAKAEKFIQVCDKGEWDAMMKVYKKNSSNLLGAASVVGILTNPVVSVIAAIIGILVLIRALTYIFFNSATKLSDYAKIQAELIKKSIEIDTNASADSLATQKKMLDFLDGLSHNIDTKILRTETAAMRAMHESNKNDFSKDIYSSAPNGADDFILA